MQVIALAQQKGGVAKSTLAIHIAAEAQRQGHRAVVLELDRQGTATYWSGQRPTDKEGKKRPPEVMKIDANQIDQTLAVLRGLGVQVVTLDLPGTHNPGVNAAIKVADIVLLPARPQDTDIVASADPLGVIQRLRKHYAYVMTFVEGKGARADEWREELEREGHPVCPHYMFRRQEYADAIVDGITVMEGGKKRAESKAAKDITEIWNWIKKQLETSHERKVERIAASDRQQTSETRH
jgi:chromosome partitioning protein